MHVSMTWCDLCLLSGECGHWQWAVTPGPGYTGAGADTPQFTGDTPTHRSRRPGTQREGEWQMNKVCCPKPCFIFCHFWHQACDYTRASEKWTLQLDITWNTFLTAKWQLVINLNKKESNHFLLNLIYPQEQGLKQFNNQSQITQFPFMWFCLKLCRSNG